MFGPVVERLIARPLNPLIIIPELVGAIANWKYFLPVTASTTLCIIYGEVYQLSVTHPTTLGLFLRSGPADKTDA